MVDMSLQTNNTPVGFEDEDIRIELYDEYSSPGQSLEQFCDMMADHLGDNWIAKLRR